MPEVRIQIDGHDYAGWEDVEINESIQALAGRFTMSVSDLPGSFPIQQGNACKVFADGDKLIDGYVDLATMERDENNHRVSISGRDKTADMVDCSAVNPSQEFLNIGFTELLKKLAAPFHVPVTVTVPKLANFKKFSLQQESAFEAIERACRLRGVLPLPAPDGGIRVVNYGDARADVSLIYGGNVKAVSVRSDFSERFSEYIVYGQQPGDDETEGEATTALMGRAYDSTIKRYRPLVVMAEGAVSLAVARDRAEWEAAVRAARSVVITATVQGWHQKPDGRLWRINELAPCELPDVAKDDYLIRDIQRVKNDNDGTLTHLTLTSKNAYLKKPDQKESRKKAREDDE